MSETASWSKSCSQSSTSSPLFFFDGVWRRFPDFTSASPDHVFDQVKIFEFSQIWSEFSLLFWICRGFALYSVAMTFRGSVGLEMVVGLSKSPSFQLPPFSRTLAGLSPKFHNRSFPSNGAETKGNSTLSFYIRSNSKLNGARSGLSRRLKPGTEGQGRWTKLSEQFLSSSLIKNQIKIFLLLKTPSRKMIPLEILVPKIIVNNRMMISLLELKLKILPVII